MGAKPLYLTEELLPEDNINISLNTWTHLDKSQSIQWSKSRLPVLSAHPEVVLLRMK